jgi:hypothetical protein
VTGSAPPLDPPSLAAGPPLGTAGVVAATVVAGTVVVEAHGSGTCAGAPRNPNGPVDAAGSLDGGELAVVVVEVVVDSAVDDVVVDNSADDDSAVDDVVVDNSADDDSGVYDSGVDVVVVVVVDVVDVVVGAHGSIVVGGGIVVVVVVVVVGVRGTENVSLGWPRALTALAV